MSGHPTIADVIVLGGGAAGLFAAATAGRRGRRVVVIEHMPEVGKKILISGGGRCNFTNRDVGPGHFLSANPHFCKSALARYGPADFVAKLEAQGIAYREKKLGQLFCVGPAAQVVRMLVAECREAGARVLTDCTTLAVRRGARFEVVTSQGDFIAAALVVATGGLSVPPLGASDLGYRLARQFGLKLTPTRPALVPLLFSPEDAAAFAGLAGVAADSEVQAGRARFRERLLFTHRGLSGPAVLQASSYWTGGADLSIDLLPGCDVAAWLTSRRASGSRSSPATALAERLPRRLADCLAERAGLSKPLSQTSDAEIARLAASVAAWRLRPAGTEGYRKAEVTAGGVSTGELSSASMEARRVPGLFFVGEVVDVTGWLGGYNFQWAWSSAHAAGQVA